MPIRTVPALTINPPENVLAPDSVRFAVPALARLNPPPPSPMTLEMVVAPAMVRIRFPVNCQAPVWKVNAPVVGEPSVTSPPKVTGTLNVRAVALFAWRIPLLKVNVPVPTALLLPICSVPRGSSSF